MAFNSSKQNLFDCEDIEESICSTEYTESDKKGNKNNNVQTVEVDVHSPAAENKSYILNKFLNESFVKPPVPKPRKSKQESQENSNASKSDSNLTHCVIGKEKNEACIKQVKSIDKETNNITKSCNDDKLKEGICNEAFENDDDEVNSDKNVLKNEEKLNKKSKGRNKKLDDGKHGNYGKKNEMYDGTDEEINNIVEVIDDLKSKELVVKDTNTNKPGHNFKNTNNLNNKENRAIIAVTDKRQLNDNKQKSPKKTNNLGQHSTSDNGSLPASDKTYNKKLSEKEKQRMIENDKDDVSNRTYSIESDKGEEDEYEESLANEDGSSNNSFASSKTFTVEENKDVENSKNVLAKTKKLLLKQKTKQKDSAVISEPKKIKSKTRLEYVNERKKDKSTKAKAKKKHKDEEEDEHQIQNESEDEDEEKDTTKHFNYDPSKTISFIIHKTDKLLLDSFVIHPVVKIHIVNSETGQYLQKSKEKIKDDMMCDKTPYISPVMTHAYNLQENRSFIPKWEETIIINENMNTLQYCNNKKKNSSQNTLILFEIMDFLTFTATVTNKRANPGWHKIAWAYLRPFNGEKAHINQRVRLQLYYPQKNQNRHHSKSSSTQCDIFHWWKNAIEKKKTKNKKYPSSLYVTIKETEKSDKEIQTLRESLKRKINLHSLKFEIEDKKVNNEDESELKIDELKKLIDDKLIKNRNANIVNLPNAVLTRLQGFEEGCFSLKFSHSGLFLAYSVLIKNSYKILVVETEEDFKEVNSFPGHQSLIYEINWTFDDKFLITASADKTVCIWGFENHTQNYIQILPHSCYVYTCCINSSNVLATGGYDGLIRIWIMNKEENEQEDFELSQELSKHEGYVTSSCFNKQGNLLYTSDSNGLIVEWTFNTGKKEWTMLREINILDIKNTKINKILLNKKEKMLLVHTRDSTIRMVDLKSLIIMFNYKGNINNRVKTASCLTPCGSYLISSSEDGNINIWSLNKSSELIGQYLKPFGLNVVVQTLDFCSNKDLLVFGSYGDVGGHSLPVLVLSFHENPKVSCLKLKINEMEHSRIRNTQNLESFQSDKIDEINHKERKEGAGGGLTRKNSIYFKNILEKLDSIIQN